MKRLRLSRRWWPSAALYVSSLLYLLFQGGKTSLMLFIMLNGLALYLALGRFSGIAGVKGVRTLEGGAGSHYLLQAGTRLKVRLQLHIPGFWPLPYVIVRDKLVRASGQDSREYELSCVPDYRRRGEIVYETAPLLRGVYRFQPTECSTRDIFGLFEHRGTFDQPLTIKVLPQTIDLKDWHVLRRSRRGVFQHAASSQWARETTQIDGVREYIHGDRLSRIHWNATARTGQWKSKEFERESLPRLVVALDRTRAAYRTSEGFELAVSVAASLLELGLKRGMPVGFVSAGEKSHWFGSGRTPVSREDLLDHLVHVEADGDAPFGPLLAEATERYEPGVHLVIVGTTPDEELLPALNVLAGRRMEPSYVHIRERIFHEEDRRRSDRWERLFISKHWAYCSVSRLEELGQALGVESA